MKGKIASCYEIRNFFKEGCPFTKCIKYNEPAKPEPCIMKQSAVGIIDEEILKEIG